VLGGCGGEQGAVPSDCSKAVLLDQRVIEDFELGAATGWYSDNEVCYACTETPTEGCTSRCLAVQREPSPLADPLPATAIPDGGRCGSAYALVVDAGPFSDWGGKIGTQFAMPLDAGAWEGITLWARIAQGSEPAARITLSDRYTDATYNESLSVPYCNPSTTKTVYKDGCDKYGSYLTMTEGWRLFRIPFTELRQEGWGKQAPAFDAAGIYSIEIGFKVGSWRLWIDDISLYRRRPG
jgi:hypothetical protein